MAHHRIAGRWIALPLAFLLSPSAALVEAQPELNFFFPAGGSVGSTVSVTASGTLENWPTEVWIDRPGLSVTSKEERGSLEFSVSDHAEPGTYWVRLYDSLGASALRPFLVGTLPEVVEQEPNDSLTQSHVLTENLIVNGRLEKSGDVDAFSVNALAGQTLVASMQAQQTLESPMDGVLQVCDENGFVLHQNHDARGLDPLIAFPIPRDGRYVVRAFSFPASPNSSISFSGGNNYVYRLTITTAGFLDHALPLAVNLQHPTRVRLQGWNVDPRAQDLSVIPTGGKNRVVAYHPDVSGTLVLPASTVGPKVVPPTTSKDAPMPLVIPSCVTGRIASPGQQHWFRPMVTTNEKLTIHVESGSLRYPLDAYVQLVEPSGKVHFEMDDESEDRDVEFTHAFKQVDDLRLMLQDRFEQGGFQYVYRLTVTRPIPDFALSLKTDRYAVKAGEKLEIPITIERKANFGETIELSAREVPSGITLEPAQSLPEGDTSKTVKLSLTATEAAATGMLRIVGTSAQTPDHNRMATFSPMSTAPGQSAVWVTVLPKSPDESSGAE